ncbi:hypothetical protein KC872_03950 [Candidatus Kaiserbacteria bacterium]|nr:hypothetical protein [Candidatus Kaiserbacteria bacterium]
MRWLLGVPKILTLTFPIQTTSGQTEMLFFASSQTARNARWIVLAPGNDVYRLVFPHQKPPFLFEDYGLRESVRNPRPFNKANISGVQLCQWLRTIEFGMYANATAVEA